jgi:hypothetical protein
MVPSGLTGGDVAGVDGLQHAGGALVDAVSVVVEVGESRPRFVSVVGGWPNGDAHGVAVHLESGRSEAGVEGGEGAVEPVEGPTEGESEAFGQVHVALCHEQSGEGGDIVVGGVVGFDRCWRVEQFAGGEAEFSQGALDVGDLGAGAEFVAAQDGTNAFVKADSEFARRGVQAWQKLGFQLIIGAPLDKVTALERYMDLILTVNKNTKGHSFVTDLPSPTGGETA